MGEAGNIRSNAPRQPSPAAGLGCCDYVKVQSTWLGLPASSAGMLRKRGRKGEADGRKQQLGFIV